MLEFCEEQLPLLHFPDVPAQKSFAVTMEAEVRKRKDKSEASMTLINVWWPLSFGTLSVEGKRKAIVAWKTRTVPLTLTKSLSDMF